MPCFYAKNAKCFVTLPAKVINDFIRGVFNHYAKGYWYWRDDSRYYL